jgi:hypothetical protein
MCGMPATSVTSAIVRPSSLCSRSHWVRSCSRENRTTDCRADTHRNPPSNDRAVGFTSARPERRRAPARIWAERGRESRLFSYVLDAPRKPRLGQVRGGCAWSRALRRRFSGIEAYRSTSRSDDAGKPMFNIVGLPDRQWGKAASGACRPPCLRPGAAAKRITVISPRRPAQEGSHYDSADRARAHGRHGRVSTDAVNEKRGAGRTGARWAHHRGRCVLPPPSARTRSAAAGSVGRVRAAAAWPARICPSSSPDA